MQRTGYHGEEKLLHLEIGKTFETLNFLISQDSLNYCEFRKYLVFEFSEVFWNPGLGL